MDLILTTFNYQILQHNFLVSIQYFIFVAKFSHELLFSITHTHTHTHTHTYTYTYTYTRTQGHKA